jgi:hypothetical protein
VSSGDKTYEKPSAFIASKNAHEGATGTDTVKVTTYKRTVIFI